MGKEKKVVPAFASVIEIIREISNYEYQSHQWVARENPKDYGCYENTIMYFLEDGEAVLNARDTGRIEMTDSQYAMLKRLYDMVDGYDRSEKRPDDDKGIVDDPEWHKIRDYAKLVYKNLVEE
ncbi:MAG: hypothetical protein KDK76_06115 [Chlamydiia bacterium]|nr:hypothetical protein [Chlamydiia bacterium]